MWLQNERGKHEKISFAHKPFHINMDQVKSLFFAHEKAVSYEKRGAKGFLLECWLRHNMKTINPSLPGWLNVIFRCLALASQMTDHQYRTAAVVLWPPLHSYGSGHFSCTGLRSNSVYLWSVTHPSTNMGGEDILSTFTLQELHSS